MTAVSSVTARQLIPNSDAFMGVITYSKAGATDFLTITTNTPIKTLRFAMCTDDTAGAEDPCTYSSTVITMSAGTLAGRVLFVGNC